MATATGDDAVQIEHLDLAGSFVVTPPRFGDSRGFFSETFRASTVTEAGVAEPFVQDNHARTEKAGTLRGLHFQKPPLGQGKLVRCIRGAILDVIVDIRSGSSTYGRHVGVELSEDNWRQLFVPIGFAHAYVTLTDNCDVLYKTTGYYAPAAEGGLLWNDPDLAIDWRLPAGQIQTNPRDQAWPRLKDLVTPF
jgi:dTDP-4-dehydrorhamnose 3,5-epimerase